MSASLVATTAAGRAADATAAMGEALRAQLIHGLPERRGMLKKLGGWCLGIQALKGVRDRWVELRGPVLEYYQDATVARQPGRAPRGVFLLDETSTVRAVSHDKLSAVAPFVFSVTTRTGEEAFAAASEGDFAEWMAALQAVIDTLRRFPAT